MLSASLQATQDVVEVSREGGTVGASIPSYPHHALLLIESTGTPSHSRHHQHHHHVTPVSHIAVSHLDDDRDGAIKVGLSTINLPILVRFRDDDTKRGYKHSE
jgi:hypothetical protein